MQNPSSAPIVLGSSSRYRRALLDRLLTEFECVAPNIDETPTPGTPAEELVVALARQKAEAVSRQHRGALVIGADQVAVLDDRILGKPGDHNAAVDQLLAAAGKNVRFLTAACILDPTTRTRLEHTDETTVQFRQFDRRLAEAYLHHDEPYDCAGSFRVEGAGFVLFDAVRSEDPTALIGLPMIWLAARLRDLNYLLP